MIKYGDEQVAEDNQRERAQLENQEQDDADQQQEITGDVHPGKLEILEFQGDHIDRADQEDGEEDGKDEHHPKAVEDGDMFGGGGDKAEEQRVGRCGHADEVLRLLGVEVELRQAHRRQRRDEEHQVGHVRGEGNLRGGRHLRITDCQPLVGDHRRRDPERDHVGERVEFLADGGGDVQQPRAEAVAEVEDGGRHDPDAREGQVAVQRRHDGEASTHQVQAGDGVRDMLFDVNFHLVILSSYYLLIRYSLFLGLTSLTLGYQALAPTGLLKEEFLF